MWGGGLGRRSTSPLPILPSPLPVTGVDAQQTPCKATAPDCELGHLEGRVGVWSEQVKTGSRDGLSQGQVGWVGLGGVTEAGADQSFSTTSAEGLGM